ncbi:hypothetical protein ACFY1U_37180 [Streptomyces sp. NPDC001351]|uniref:hypothetical protein n=1 Tax=Streptomyces sp. NPDC001351 TaxID=3364564 RepID=UPI0036B4A939
MTRNRIEPRTVEAALHDVKQAMAVHWAATLGVTYIQVVDRRTELTPEEGQPADWLSLDEAWQGWFPEDRLRMKRCAQWLGERGRRVRGS